MPSYYFAFGYDARDRRVYRKRTTYRKAVEALRELKRERFLTCTGVTLHPVDEVIFGAVTPDGKEVQNPPKLVGETKLTPMQVPADERQPMPGRPAKGKQTCRKNQ